MCTLGRAHHEFASYRGGLQYMFVGQWKHSLPAMYGRFDRATSEDLWSPAAISPTSHRAFAGFALASGSTPGPADSYEPPVRQPFHYYQLLRIPYWFLMISLLLPFARWAFLLHRRRRWVRTGHCAACGYDLRASVGRCPECGLGV